MRAHRRARAEGETIGSLAAISRSTRRRLPAGGEDALEALARRAGPAIWNARRYSEARELAELDSLTGLHNRRLFYEFLGREIARARRYERFVSLIVSTSTTSSGSTTGSATSAATRRSTRSPSASARSCARPTSLPRRRRRVRGDPPRVEPGRRRALADRISLAIRAQKIDKVGALKISAGVSELRADDTAADLFKRADDALLRAKGSGKARIVAS